MKQLIVNKGRTNIVSVSLGYDVSADVLTSEIREDIKGESDLLATWTVTNRTDGTDGEVILTLGSLVTAGISKKVGYMDMKRVSSGEPIPVFDEPIEVIFKETITA